jgi:hypothetical protein
MVELVGNREEETLNVDDFGTPAYADERSRPAYECLFNWLFRLSFAAIWKR